MTHNLSRVDAVQFLLNNRIQGRVFTNLFLSNYLFFHVPKITLYFDLRPHIFPESVTRTYLSVFNPR